VLGVDHELMANFGVSANFTWRRFVDFNWRNNGITGEDYQQLGTFTGSLEPVGSFSVPFYGAIPANIPANRAATEYRTRPDYSQRYLGFEVAATKRLSDRWMARFGFSTNDHREYFDSAEAFTNPTPSAANPNIDGGQVLRQTGGSGKSGIFMLLPKYQFIATGLYQAPWGINLAGNLLTRQGYATPYTRSQVATGDPLGNLKTLLVVGDVGDFRLPAVTSLDLRVGKEFTINRFRLALDLDMFNALNSNVVLGRQYDLRLTTANQVLEIMNPRILRLGARINF
jgi:hypothetical protein